MNLLFVNDDGIASAQLHLIARAARARGHHVLVCAPSQQQSGKSHSFHITSAVTVHPFALDGVDAAWSVDGTPVDCTRLGLMELTDRKIDLVISGINQGYNIGLATYVSGTVGAAREATFHGVKAMAVSAEPHTSAATLSFFAEWLITLAERYVTADTPPLTVCNVNIPPVEVHELQPPVICPINRHIDQDEYIRRENPRGVTYFWLTAAQWDETPEPGSDAAMLQKGHITVSMLTVDGGACTDYAELLSDL